MTKTRKQLAIVGGGDPGRDLATSLDGEMDVTLIERASHFTHASLWPARWLNLRCWIRR